MVSYSPEQYFHKVDNMILISYQCLRKLFQKRWKQETGRDWEHTEEQGKAFIEGAGAKLFKMTNDKKQKEKIVKGCLDDWDMTTLSLVLRNYPDPVSYKDENEAIGKLKKLRNDDIAHHPTKMFSEAEYNEKVELIRACLRAIQVEESEIDKIIESAGITSSVAALEATKKLYEDAEEHMKNEEFDKALECYNDATTMRSLLPVHQGLSHEQRAHFYLKLANQKKQSQNEDQSVNFIEKALLDARVAIDLNDNSWNAHYLIAQCYRRQTNFELAIKSYCQALAISPVQKHVKQETDSCKALLGFCTKQDYRLIDLEERISHFITELGRQVLTEDHFIHEKTRLHDVNVIGKVDVFRGMEYAMGWSVSQHDEEAARYFAKADKVGNPDGSFNLGVCYAKGKGVTQDLTRACLLYFKAADMSPDFTGIATSVGKNIGVAAAQHCLGLIFENGIQNHVDQDNWEAVMWFMKAVENGIGNAATNLAKMYDHGVGVPKKEKDAEKYWKRGVELGDPNAAEALVGYYKRQMEPSLAREMFEKGKQLGSTGMNGITDEELNKVIEIIMDEDELRSLDNNGMTFFERLQRYQFTKDEKYPKIIKDLQQIHSKESWGGEISQMNETTLEQLAMLAHKGSTSADKVLRAIKISLEVADFLEKETITEDERNSASNLIYECLTLHLTTATGLLFPDADGKTKLKRLLGQLFESCLVGKKSEEEMKIRFCYAFFNQKVKTGKSDDTFMFDLLKQGIGMYPDNMYYYLSLSNLYSHIGDHKSALAHAMKGLEQFPNNEDLLYYKANQKVLMLPELEVNEIQALPSGLVEDEIKEGIKACKEFLKSTSHEHRKLPEVYYSLGYLQVLEFKSKCQAQKSSNLEKEKSRMLRKMKFFLSLGKETEENRLPCYLPYEECKYKTIVERMLANPETMKQKKSESDEPSQSSAGAPQQGMINNILETKQYLANATRHHGILQHRQRISLLRTMRSPDFVTVLGLKQRPELTQKSPRRMAGMKSITLKDMDTTGDKIFQDCMIDLTIIEDPVFASKFVHILAEDENGDVTRLDVYNFKPNKVNEGKLELGCKIAILNPYYVGVESSGRGGSSTTVNVMRNDESKCIIYLGKKVEQMQNCCRFCGEVNGSDSVNCSICHKAWYCSSECRRHDRKILGHDLVCFN